MTSVPPAMLYIALALAALLLISVTLAGCAFWQARRAWRSSERARREQLAATQALRSDLGKELRPMRLQLSNVINLLLGAGFKKRRQGWEDDFDETQQREDVPDMSWWRPKR